MSALDEYFDNTDGFWDTGSSTPTTTTSGGGSGGDSSWTKALNNLLTVGSNVFTGYTNAQVVKANAANNAKLASANAQNQSSSLTKYLLIGGGVLALVFVAFIIFRRK